LFVFFLFFFFFSSRRRHTRFKCDWSSDVCSSDLSLRKTGTVVEVDHPTRGTYLTVGNPIKLSDSPADVRRSPLLGEHTDEVLRRSEERRVGKACTARRGARACIMRMA